MLFLINRMLLLQIYSLFKPHAFASSAASDAAQTVAGFSGRTVVKYSDRGVRYVYSAAARPACRIMEVWRGWCCCCGFASAGLGRMRYWECRRIAIRGGEF